MIWMRRDKEDYQLYRMVMVLKGWRYTESKEWLVHGCCVYCMDMIFPKEECHIS